MARKPPVAESPWRKHILYKDISRDLNVILDAESVVEPVRAMDAVRRIFTATKDLRENKRIRDAIYFTRGP